ncbi:helix-turn-helix domain-containing protein [Novosphingobium sp. TW-4]|uniref:Helix-turn-helix domain-containing protein n=2 Tax=Novosphingobium olei TaxID=2728851 RepID=A0A7Y0BPX1_9SPHN|nr:helix-turn-helix domain-containing protein [Novosphingobium olei]
MVGTDRHIVAKRAAKRRELIQRDPQYRARHLANLYKHATMAPAAIEERARRSQEIFLNPEYRAKASVAARAVRLAHIPEHLRDEYLRLAVHGLKAAERREIVLAHFRREDPIAAAAFEGRNIKAFAPKSLIDADLRKLGWRMLIRAVAERFNVTEAEVLSAKRSSELIHARAIVAQELRRRGMSLALIGERLGRDHTTILNLLRRVQSYADSNPVVARCLIEIHRERGVQAA